MKLARTGKLVVVVFAMAWLIKEVVMPVGAAAVYSSDYMALAFQCDEAMEASWYYRQDKSFDPRTEIVQMLSCHDYDKTRKLMLMAGLPEAYLSWLGLKSLELYQRPPEEYVEQHRFTVR